MIQKLTYKLTCTILFLEIISILLYFLIFIKLKKNSIYFVSSDFI